MSNAANQGSVFRRALQIDGMGVVAGFALLGPISTSLPSDLAKFSSSDCDGPYTVLMFAKYGYAMWFAAYFFLGRVLRERAKDCGEKLSTGSVAFDVLQIAGGLVAASYLGFFGSKVDPGRTGFLVMAIVILAISGLSLLFRDSDSNETRPTLQHVRLAGCVVSLLAAAAIRRSRSDVSLAAFVAAALTLHSLLLVRFAFLMRGRERRRPASREAADAVPGSHDSAEPGAPRLAHAPADEPAGTAAAKAAAPEVKEAEKKATAQLSTTPPPKPEELVAVAPPPPDPPSPQPRPPNVA
jgi:hypothetical protein